MIAGAFRPLGVASEPPGGSRGAPASGPERSGVEADERPGRLGTAGETSRRTGPSVERRREWTKASEPSFSFFYSPADQGSWTHTFF